MKSRESYLDWLRVMAIIGVLVFHAAMAWVAGEEWHIKDREQSNLLLEFTFWLSRFRMPLLFFISGTVAWFMLQHRSILNFVGLRFRRLFIPLAFGMFVIVPPQIYMERLRQGFPGSYFDFYPRVFGFEAYPKGDFSWHHLWFIWYLFVYDVVLAPVFKWCTSSRGRKFLQRLEPLGRGAWIYVLMIPSVLAYCFFIIDNDQTNDFIHDGFFFFYWLLFLLAGFICIAQSALMNSLERNRRLSLAIAFLSFLAINYFRWNNQEPFDILPDWRSDWRTYAYLALFGITAWSWVFSAIGYGKKYLNKRTRALDYMNKAAYPFYILHQTIIVILAYYVVQTRESILMKYLFTVIAAFAITVLIYHLFIRPFAITRFLFGMKPNEKQRPAKGTAQPARDTASNFTNLSV